MLPDQAGGQHRVVERRDQHIGGHGARNAGRIPRCLRKIPRPLRRQAEQAPIGHAVIAALEFQNLVPLAKGARQPHGVGIRLRAGRHEADFLRARHRFDNGRGQLDALGVVGEERRALADLCLRRRRHLRVRMAEEHRPGPKQEVDILIAAFVPHPPALALADDDVERQIAESPGRQHFPGLFQQFFFNFAAGHGGISGLGMAYAMRTDGARQATGGHAHASPAQRFLAIVRRSSDNPLVIPVIA